MFNKNLFVVTLTFILRTYDFMSINRDQPLEICDPLYM